MFATLCACSALTLRIAKARKLVCTKPFDPAVFMGASWSAAEEDERAESLPEIDVSAITFGKLSQAGA
jgi:hypothetical protein